MSVLLGNTACYGSYDILKLLKKRQFYQKHLSLWQLHRTGEQLM